MCSIASSAATVAIAISDEPAEWLIVAERALPTHAIVLSKSAQMAEGTQVSGKSGGY